jgi:hypothetical protein
MASYVADTGPQLKEEILSIDDEYIVERDSFGEVLKNHRNFTTTPMIIDYSCKSRDDWEKLKPRLQPNDRRVDWVADLHKNQKERSRGRYIVYNATVGYDKFQKYVASERLLKAVI